jgi:ribosome biogenesis GTPase
MQCPVPTLAQLGWNPFFSDQVSDAELRECQPVRVMSVHRGMVTVLGDEIDGMISSLLGAPQGPEDRPTVGDWLLIDRESHEIMRVLNRTSLFKRPAPGDDRRLQLIAANVDTLFIVTSCDQDFNVARLERYLVLAREVNVRPVVVLTKADLSPAPQHYVEAARALQPQLLVELINGRDPASVAGLASHCALGQTVALVGSSGVGKSTLVNTLKGSDSIATQAVRESDGKGLHTTTVRQMHRLGSGDEGGGWLVDTPGMRELQMSEVADGVAEVFHDFTALTLECRFSNCTHADEPGCAVQVAIAQGELDPERFERWRKLSMEDEANTGVAAVRRARSPKPSKRKK